MSFNDKISLKIGHGTAFVPLDKAMDRGLSSDVISQWLVLKHSVYSPDAVHPISAIMIGMVSALSEDFKVDRRDSLRSFLR